MRSRAVACLLLVLAAVAAGVASFRSAPPPPAAPLRGAARRIVTASPALVECLFAIGAGDRVAGVSRFCTFPAEAAALPRIGGFLDPNLLAIEGLRPDLILVQGSAQTNAAVETFAAGRSIPVERFTIETTADVLLALERLGRLADREAAAAAEVARLRAALASVRAPEGPRPRVVLSLQRSPGELRGVDTAGRRSFVVECLEAAGGETLFPDFEKGYRTMSREAVLERRPDAIVELRTDPAPPELEAALRRDWAAAFPDAPAVRAGRIHVVVDDAALIPGPRLDRVVAKLAAALRSPGAP